MTDSPELHAVWKFELKRQNNTLEVPVGSRILSVGMQLGYVCVWAQVPVSQRLMELRSIHVIPTGMQWVGSGDIVFLGTAVTGPPNNLVWHVYEYGGEARSGELQPRPDNVRRRGEDDETVA